MATYDDQIGYISGQGGLSALGVNAVGGCTVELDFKKIAAERALAKLPALVASDVLVVANLPEHVICTNAQLSITKIKGSQCRVKLGHDGTDSILLGQTNVNLIGTYLSKANNKIVGSDTRKIILTLDDLPGDTILVVNLILMDCRPI